MRTPNLRFTCVVALTSVTLAATTWLDRRKPDGLALPLETVSATLSGWRAMRDLAVDDRTVRVLSATSYLDRIYQKGPTSIEFFVAYYDQQRAGESMHSPKNCLPGSGWDIWKYDTTTIHLVDQSITVNRDSLRHDDAAFLMFYWYQSKRKIVASEFLGKLQLMQDSMLSGSTSGSIVRILIPDGPRADSDASQFVANVIPELDRCLGKSAIGPLRK